METFVDHTLLNFDFSQDVEITLPWTSLLYYLDLEKILEKIPKFKEESSLFPLLTSCHRLPDDTVTELYDLLFAECLTQIKNLSEIHPEFLLEKIQAKVSPPQFAASLGQWKKILLERPYQAAHDLILYLAFDRMCVHIAFLFEQAKQDLNTARILRSHLIESFHHIAKDRKTSPGFFRLAEALYAYEMKEENIQGHSDSDWAILCQSAIGLKDRESLLDLFYVDQSIFKIDPVTCFTGDAKEQVAARLQLASFMLKKLEKEVPNFSYFLSPAKIVYF